MSLAGSKKWDSLNLNEAIIKSIEELKFETMTPVQATCIPLFLSHKDLAVEAVTGSGKTLAFIIPILEMLLKLPALKSHDVKALIISPTRELASQICDVLKHFLKNLPQFTHMLIIGGCKSSAAQTKFENVGSHIIVSTPGRLSAMLENKTSTLKNHLRNIEVLILDEADRLLEMGFEASINTIISYLPKQRRTGLFSATQTKEVEDLIRAGLRNPVSIVVKDKKPNSDLVQRTPASLSNYYTVIEPHLKFSSLVNFLRTKKGEKHIVFMSTCSSVNYFGCLLQKILKRVSFSMIHGKLRAKRQKIFDNFKTLKNGVLLCTDLMARGIDIPDVDWVIQYDPPNSASSFVHRCGRTARQGNTGSAMLFMLPTEEVYLKFLEINQKVSLEEADISSDVMDFTTKIREMSSKDRDLFEKGTKAFVSYIQAYSKHDCNHIFKLKDLDFGKLAMGFGLLKLPKMPELNKIDVTGFEKANIDFQSICYLDKTRETKRQENLVVLKETGHWPGKEVPKIIYKKETKKCKPMNSKKRKAQHSFEEWEELKNDARFLKKMKKNKITSEEFDEHFQI